MKSPLPNSQARAAWLGFAPDGLGDVPHDLNRIPVGVEILAMEFSFPTNPGKAPKPTIFQQGHSGHVRRMSGHTNILLVPAEGVRQPSLSIQSQFNSPTNTSK
jgi:hypothetical protein